MDGNCGGALHSESNDLTLRRLMSYIYGAPILDVSSSDLLMMSGVSLETCLAFNKLWNNKFYYNLHLVGISNESSTMHGSMNIKWKRTLS